MILNGKDVTDKEFFDKIIPLDNKFRVYLINYIVPEAVAFYLKNATTKNVYVKQLFIIISILQ